MKYLTNHELAATIRKMQPNATEGGAWQWGVAGNMNFVGWAGDDIVGVASFRAKSDADFAALLASHALRIADALEREPSPPFPIVPV